MNEPRYISRFKRCKFCRKERHVDTFVNEKCVVCRKGLEIPSSNIRKRTY